MGEREAIQDHTIYDPPPFVLKDFSDLIRSGSERMTLVASERSIIGRNPVLSDCIGEISEQLVNAGQRVNEFLESAAIMHVLLGSRIIEGYPIISTATREGFTFADSNKRTYLKKYPNLMDWVSFQCNNSKGNDKQAELGFMITFGLAYKELSPPKKPFKLINWVRR